MKNLKNLVQFEPRSSPDATLFNYSHHCPPFDMGDVSDSIPHTLRSALNAMRCDE